MQEDPFVSYGQNHEDVVLWRALGSLESGFYVDVGANDPTTDSVTKAFYDRGWSGINIEPLPDDASRLQEARPRDTTVQAAVTSTSTATITLHAFAGTGLSTMDASIAQRHIGAGFACSDVEVPAISLNDVLAQNDLTGHDIHFLKIDVEGAEADVLASIDFGRWRPWVLVVEATAPLSTNSTHEAWEPALLRARYQFCMFDGISRFYVADEHAEDLKARLSYPACALDKFVPKATADADTLIGSLTADLVRWRGVALRGWDMEAKALSSKPELEAAQAAVAAAQAELARTRSTLSWRITRPLRAVRAASGRGATT